MFKPGRHETEGTNPKTDPARSFYRTHWPSKRRLRLWRVYPCLEFDKPLECYADSRTRYVHKLYCAFQNFAVFKGIMHVRGWPGTRLACAQWWARVQPTAKTLYWVGFVILMWCLLGGCISIGTHERLVKASFVAGLEKGKRYAAQGDCTSAVTSIDKRLKALADDSIPND